MLFHTGVALKAIDAFAALIRRVPARLAVIAIVAGTVFSAISGSTIATTALLGSLLLPTMLDRGYHPRMAMGPIMGIGGVDMLIPPSALTVLLGSLAGISITGLLMGGILPGLMLSALFVGYIVARAAINPRLAPDEVLESGPSGLRRWIPFVVHVLPLILIFAVVVGAMAAGWATPTEAAALGCPGPNQMKSFLRCGMGPCQGRLCGLTVTELIAAEFPVMKRNEDDSGGNDVAHLCRGNDCPAARRDPDRIAIADSKPVGVVMADGYKDGRRSIVQRRRFPRLRPRVPVIHLTAADRDDQYNRACTDLFAGLRLARRAILVPAPVVAEVGYLLGRAGGRFLQHLPIGLRNLGVIGVNFAKGQEPVPFAAIVDEGRLQRRLNPRHLGEIDIASELFAVLALEIEFFNASSVDHHHTRLFGVRGVD